MLVDTMKTRKHPNPEPMQREFLRRFDAAPRLPARFACRDGNRQSISPPVKLAGSFGLIDSGISKGVGVVDVTAVAGWLNAGQIRSSSNCDPRFQSLDSFPSEVIDVGGTAFPDSDDIAGC